MDGPLAVSSLSIAGPGETLARVLDGWARGCVPAGEPAGLIPPAWRVLMRLGPRDGGGWRAQWAVPVRLGEVAPGAWVLWQHCVHGAIGSDVDPDDNGHRPVWWQRGNHVRRLCNDWYALADALAGGAEGLMAMCQAQPASPVPVDRDGLGIDPLARAWLERLDAEGSKWHWWMLADSGQGLDLPRGWRRHPTAPLFAVPARLAR